MLRPILASPAPIKERMVSYIVAWTRARRTTIDIAACGIRNVRAHRVVVVGRLSTLSQTLLWTST